VPPLSQLSWLELKRHFVLEIVSRIQPIDHLFLERLSLIFSSSAHGDSCQNPAISTASRFSFPLLKVPEHGFFQSAGVRLPHVENPARQLRSDHVHARFSSQPKNPAGLEPYFSVARELFHAFPKIRSKIRFKKSTIIWNSRRKPGGSGATMQTSFEKPLSSPLTPTAEAT